MSLQPDFFELSPRARDYRERLTAFMEEHVYPNEREYHEQGQTGDRWQPRPLIEELKSKAQAAG